MNILFFYTAAYLLGSIPFGLILARMVKGIDIREHGSRNIGATNVFRVVGKKWGIFVFFLDALKGYCAVSLPKILQGTDLSFPQLLSLGVCAILGHTFPIWLKFKGGKGVATSLGVFLAAAPVPAWLTFVLWNIVFFSTRILSVGSLAAAAAFPLICFLTYRNRPELQWLLPISILLCLFIFYTHRANIRRLMNKEEKRLF